jgi:predicted cytidylate kinase
MINGNGRPKNLGLLFVVGGFGGSGATTIAKMLARNFSLKRIYAGGLMREIAKQKGFPTYEDFLKSITDIELEKLDKELDRKMVKYSYMPNTLIDSKIFASLCSKYNIQTTVRIWLDCDIEVRAKRKALKDNLKYEDVLTNLQMRFMKDKERFEKLYSIDYSSPKKYNDIVIDITKLNENQTLKLILELISNGRYISK